MNLKQAIVNSKRWFRLNRKSIKYSDEPRAADLLLDADHMEHHSIKLAQSHETTQKRSSYVLLSHLRKESDFLLQSCKLLADRTIDSFSPGREWLLDNEYLIQGQILAIKRDLPKHYLRKLPCLCGRSAGFPRVYDISSEIIKHTDGRWDLENLTRFVSSYQGVSQLLLAELWAIPVMLRAALIEALSHASQQIVADRNDRAKAETWAERILDVANSEPSQLVIVVAEMVTLMPAMSGAFIVELARRLQRETLNLPLTWIEQHLEESGRTLEQLVQEENKHQAENQVTISNCILSLRRIDETNWRNFVESMSVVEKILRNDPTNTYANMDFGTRDNYRRMVENLAILSKRTEESVASCAIQSAQTHGAHVGFYLIGNKLPLLKKQLGLRPSSFRQALSLYAGTISLITAFLTTALLLKAINDGLAIGWTVVLGLTLSICASQLAIALSNLLVSSFIKPKRLPRMDFKKGIPSNYRSLVVVPSLLDKESRVDALVKALEVRFLGNRDPHLHFMLLTDFNDGDQEHEPGDEEILASAHKLIDALNKKYPGNDGDIFFLCHRKRQWNCVEELWMGRERKRGKLEDLNRLIRGNNKTPFSVIIGNTDKLSDVKFVITLDSDTLLPHQTAHQLVGTMAHPLNRPVLDAEKQIVIQGHGILQPRVAKELPIEGMNSYARIVGDDFGLDPYTRTVSDVYQDVFDEGSFIGKGIYDVDIFQQVLEDRLPNNRILSHDLLEGCYLRSGFLSDVPLYEEFPSSYLVDSKRRIRWIRGDWQIFNWLLSWVPNAKGEYVANPLSALSKFKILDNFRRSLVPIALLLLFLLDWVVLPAKVFWFVSIIGIIVFPSAIILIWECLRNISQVATITEKWISRTVLYVTSLPHEAWYSLVAISRTCWRIAISRKHLLEWLPTDQVNRGNGNAKWLIELWMGPFVALLSCAILLVQTELETLILTLPLLLLWMISPLALRFVSRPFKRHIPKISREQRRFLHVTARKTWLFFEKFITSEDHWLPPDNYQEEPVESIARRTSPTNIGLSLLANLTAYDFGYITMSQLLTRTSDALESMSKLPRYKGHFYNWYRTDNLQPLLPLYISTVDSGNLSANLLVLRQGLIDLKDRVLLNPRYLDGVLDTSELLTTVLQEAPARAAMTRFNKLLIETRASFRSWSAASNSCQALCRAAEKMESNEWSKCLIQHSHALRDEINLFASIPGITTQTTLQEAAHLFFSEQAKKRLLLIDSLILQLSTLAQMDFNFLYDEGSHLMSIGYRVDEQRHDPSRYDLLASEARLGTFVAVAQGQIPEDSWFALSRWLVSNKEHPLWHPPVLVSWSGSMFEYLMPLLVMPTYSETLLDQSCREAVKWQIAYGQKHGVPWGMSESGFNAVDSQFNYLYRAFGIPDLGLKRGLVEDLVIAPYASVLALMIAPQAACSNLQRLAKEEVLGKFGFYEAIDFTPSRVPEGSKNAIVRSFMAHHEGMSFLAFSYFLNDQPMQKRFWSDLQFRSTLLLLQERIPKITPSTLRTPSSLEGEDTVAKPAISLREFHTPHTSTPQVKLLSNGRYHVAVTQAGGGYSRWKDVALTRWREDSTRDNFGHFAYIRDVETREFWSSIYQPTAGPVTDFKATFTDVHAAFSRKIGSLDIQTEIAVSHEDDIELRRVRVYNRSGKKRVIELTSYAEIVLTSQAADLAQPVFSNLFIETKIDRENQVIFACRRQQDDRAYSPNFFHKLNVYENAAKISYETDRARFVGRGNNLASPLAMIIDGDLSNSKGNVLDPIVAIRCRVSIEPHSSVRFDLINGVAETQEQCQALAERYRDFRWANRIFDLAKAHAQVLLHHLNISEGNAQLYGLLAGAIIYATNRYRAPGSIIASNRQGQSGLWKYGLSGDLPIVLVRIEDAENLELVKQLIEAQAYWRRKNLIVDLFVINEERIGYRQNLQDWIISLMPETTHSEQQGRIIVRSMEQVPSEDLILLQSIARVFLSDKRGTLKEQLVDRPILPKMPPMLGADKSKRNYRLEELSPMPKGLLFFNGLGGFSAEGDEYIIRLRSNETTPAPWINILANPNFGTTVSESGQGYTWMENAHEFRLTPWENDPMQDSTGEALYLRDEETGRIWSPTVLPCRGEGDYQIRHGFGYSVFEHIENGIHSELWVYVARDASIKFSVLKIRNDSKERRMLSATGFATFVLGDFSASNKMHVTTELANNGSILAQNHYNTDFGERAAFFNVGTTHVDLTRRTATGDRTEFLGRNGSPEQPAALNREFLSGKMGAGLDPCAAIQLSFSLKAGQSREIVFTLGAAQNRAEALELAERYTSISMANEVLVGVRAYWKRTLGVIRVTTPDPSFNLLANGWLLYQLLSSRLWGRTGYYQSSGAFGFRDQLQDVMALAQISPSLFRNHLLLCAARQYKEGDVQHWWHPQTGRGVRTRCTDDYLWLPFALCRYVETTGDMGILDENIPYLEGRPLNEDEESYYDLPITSHESASLYQHAVQAIKHSLKFGAHGLPLMGSGDWNDGMNFVGKNGRGESVWLGFFAYAVLTRFSQMASKHGDVEFSKLCNLNAVKLQEHLESNGWDGEWYRRAYFDDGTPLGSGQNNECRIDSLPQSWSVLSGAAASNRTIKAMASVKQYLVSEPNQLIKLLDPPFDKSIPSPGYIQGYPPGVRENGSQYAHAAVWATMAFAKIGDLETAWKLFDMINPVSHSKDREEVSRYRIEPYVVAADIYSVAPHIGRGGWSWYTGSAGWLYQLLIETFLGLKLEDGKYLRFSPCVPNTWNGFSVEYHYRNTLYRITAKSGAGMSGLLLDAVKLDGDVVLLVDDGKNHEIIFFY